MDIIRMGLKRDAWHWTKETVGRLHHSDIRYALQDFALSASFLDVLTVLHLWLLAYPTLTFFNAFV
jgi:hypothetical protein